MNKPTLDSISLKTILKRAIVFGSFTFIAYLFGKKLLKYRHAIPSKKDSRDYTIAPAKATTFPFSFSLPTPPVENQESVSSCHDAQTEVLTRQGWKFFKDITYEDKLASVNPDDGNLIWENPTNIIKERYAGGMVHVKHQSLDYMVTPNHEMVVRKYVQKIGKLTEDYHRVKASEMPWWVGYRADFHQKNDNIKGKIILGEELVSNGNTLEHKEIELSDWVEFIGIYLAEGTMCNILHHYRIQIAGVKKRERDYIEDLLKRIGINASSYKDRYVIHNKRVWMKLNELGLYRVKSYNKYVPDFIFDLDESLIRKFLYAFAMGDGHFMKEGGVRYSTSSPVMADQLQRLMLMSGYNARLYENDNRGKECKMKDGRIIIAKHIGYVISQWKFNRSSSTTSNYSLVPYDGYVYCAEVPTYHTLITKRNGQTLLSGNCVAHSCSYLCESVLNPKGKQGDRHFATGFVYGYRPKEYYQGEGMFPREALKTLKDIGNVPKDIFPFNVEVPEAINLVNSNLPNLLQVAKQNKVSNFFRLNTVDDIKNCLMNYGPVTGMFPVYASLEKPIDDKVEYVGDVGFRGYHEMTIYGWTGNYWNTLNSWGGSWSGDGVALISFAYPIVETWGVSKVAEAVVVPPVKKPWYSIFCPWRQ